MDQYGATNAGKTDAYGNPIRGTTGKQTVAGVAHDEPLIAHPAVTVTEHQGGTVLRRSGSSSSSSSSEDDGMGGRRKKRGLKEKIKGKLSGGHKTDEHGYGQGQEHAAMGYGGTTATNGAHHEQHEKKGIMDRIKEKLPGGHKTDEHGQGQVHVAATPAAAVGHGGTTAATGAHPEHEEKKGFMEKIKEKLPGHH